MANINKTAQLIIIIFLSILFSCMPGSINLTSKSDIKNEFTYLYIDHGAEDRIGSIYIKYIDDKEIEKQNKELYKLFAGQHTIKLGFEDYDTYNLQSLKIIYNFKPNKYYQLKVVLQNNEYICILNETSKSKIRKNKKRDCNQVLLYLMYGEGYFCGCIPLK